MVADELGDFAADSDVTMQGHVHAGAHGRAIDHGDGRFADERDVPMELGESVEKVLAGEVGAFSVVPVAHEVLAQDGRVIVPAHVGPGAEALALAGQHDHLDGRIVVGGPHVFAHFGDSAVLLGVAHEGVEGKSSGEDGASLATRQRI